MDIDLLKSKLDEIYENPGEIGITLYAVLKENENVPHKLDIDTDSLNELKTLFIQSLKDSISEQPDLSVLDLSTSDERVDVIYRYDVDIPDELASIDTVINNDNIDLLNLNDHRLLKIKALVIEIGNEQNQLVLYKTMAPINIFGRANFFLKKTNQRLKKIDDEFLRVSSGFQLLKIAGELLVLDLNVIERSFGFHEIIKKEAEKGIEAISNKMLIQNPEVLKDLLSEIKYARRLTKIAASSPVLKANIENERIIDFCKHYPTLKGRIKFNDEQTMISLTTNVSKDLFLKLLMDDFLTSELTKHHYESVAKDSADTQNNV